MIRKLLRGPIAALLKRFGYRMVPAAAQWPQLDIDRVGGPIGLFYHAQVRPFVVQLPLERARSNLYPLDVHVFAVAAKRALAGSAPGIDRIRETLATYRALTDYRNAAEKVGLTARDAPALAEGPAWVRLRPWVTTSLAGEAERLQRSMFREGRAHGVPFERPEDAFLTTGGDGIIELHAVRIERLLASMKRHGFIAVPASGHVTAELLVDDDERWCWNVGAGNHRVSVAHALGVESIPVCVLRIVHRRDVMAWPNVLAGTYSAEAALAVFDNAMDGRAPAKARAWVDACAVPSGLAPITARGAIG